MFILRIVAVVLAASLMGGEIWRSWGLQRPLVFVLDDMVLGLFLITTAWAVRVPSLRRRAAFSAAWAFASGMLYPSFFDKIVHPADAETGNWSLGVLTVLVGLAFATSLFGLVVSIALPPKSTSPSSL